MAHPSIAGLLETALYVEDMERSVTFFEATLGLACMQRGAHLSVFDAGRQGVLLLFRRGASVEDTHTPDGIIPGHDGAGPLHMAFAIAAADYEPWRAHLRAAGVRLRGEMRWPRGGRSLYFEDPDGNVLEFATPGLWPNY